MTDEAEVSIERASDLVRKLYLAFLQREASEEEISAHAASIRSNYPLKAITNIIYSAEALARHRSEVEAAPALSTSSTFPISRDDVTEIVRRTIASVRREQPSAFEVTLRVEEFRRGARLAEVLDDVLIVHPDLPITNEDSASITRTIEVIYRLALQRSPRPQDLEEWSKIADSRGRLSDAIFGISDSAEATQLRRPADVAPGILIQLAFETVLGRGAFPQEVEHFRRLFEEGGTDIPTMVSTFFREEANRRLSRSSEVNNPNFTYIFGSRGVVDIDEWKSKKPFDKPRLDHTVMNETSAIRMNSASECVVSVITSLYRGGEFIKSFLENITSQSIFRSHCELIIIDADSPENEQATILSYCERFPNIVYRRMTSRIGIYEAWNLAVEIASGRYITNANLDDCRRIDSLEIQAAVLDSLAFVDVTYQDVLYSFEPRLTFSAIEAHDFCSNLPIISQYNLTEFNSPHNAPMWRKTVHDDVGRFNETLKSAADFDFWLRCRMHGKTFYKINDPHVAYFVNPAGMSTRPNTHGLAEANSISKTLFRKIVSPMLLVTHTEFLAEIDSIGEVPHRHGARYDIIQSALIALGQRREGAHQ